MSAFLELAKFVEAHPEIRAHKKMGDLLLDLGVEIQHDKTQLDQLSAELIEAGEIIQSVSEDRNEQLRLLHASLFTTQKQLDVACHIDAEDKVEFDWGVLTKIEDQRIEFEELQEALEDANLIFNQLKDTPNSRAAIKANYWLTKYAALLKKIDDVK